MKSPARAFESGLGGVGFVGACGRGGGLPQSERAVKTP